MDDLNKKIEREQAFGDAFGEIVVAVLIALMLLFFLSSPRPALGAISPSMVMENTIEKRIIVGDDFPELFQKPVPYLYWDTSTAMNGWYNLMAYQLALGIYEAQEKAEQKAKDDLLMAEWRKNKADRNKFFAVAGFLLVICLFWAVWLQQRRKP